MTAGGASPRAGAPRIVVLGRQGSGKGTQAARLASTFGVPHVSTGDAFRAAAKDGSKLGRAVQGYMDRGELVPDDVVVAVVKEHLFGPGAPDGFILDGFPRTVAQAEALAKMAEPHGVDVVIDLEVGNEEVVRRISGRRVCPNCGANYNLVDSPPKVAGACDLCGQGPLVQRDDDTEEAVRRRLEIYEQMTAPLIDWYRARGILVRVDATGTPDEVTDRVVAGVHSALAKRLQR
ncbi:MAG TPA: adenylate kinase [Acidimicrobiales bacterium]|nr:adenylate kinase [Acidimicrobiales bacterium]